MGADTFIYDANGNQTTRKVGSDTYDLIYDAENRLTQVKKKNTVVATFVYDGDGNRVKGTIEGKPNDTITSYIGNIYEYETVGAAVTTRKYYYAGGTRIAVRVNSTLSWLIGDHLGSTAITASNSGALSTEIRYYPWGTERYMYGTTPTTYHFTGQRLESGIGLNYYGARWYDPSAGRFIQADTIIPRGVQGLDRYAYVNNNPLRYIDPTGYDSSSAQYGSEVEDCKLFFCQYNVRLSGNWRGKYLELLAVINAVKAAGAKFAEYIGGTAASAFNTVFQNGVDVVWDPYCKGCRSGTIKGTNTPCGDDFSSPGCIPGGGFTVGHVITFASMTGGYLNDLSRMTKNVVHELGEAFYNALGRRPALVESFSRDALRPDPEDYLDWQQHPPSMNEDKIDNPNDLFSDTFIAWTYDAWNPSNDPKIVLKVDQARDAMNNFAAKP